MTDMSVVEREPAKPFGLFFQALANPSRMRIIHYLKTAEGGRSVSQICGELGLEQTQASHALRCLAFCGLVTSARSGKSVIYTLNSETILPLLDMVETHLRKYGSGLYACDALER
jgi:DNA-binding transcriptional ArsR family regulator